MIVIPREGVESLLLMKLNGIMITQVIPREGVERYTLLVASRVVVVTVIPREGVESGITMGRMAVPRVRDPERGS